MVEKIAGALLKLPSCVVGFLAVGAALLFALLLAAALNSKEGR